MDQLPTDDADTAWDPMPLRAAVAAVAQIDVDTHSDAGLRDVLSDLRRPVAQLQAVITRLAGELRPEHARVITDLLRKIPSTRRTEVEQELVDLARRNDPVTFGRQARSILARENMAALERREKREHIQRSVRIGRTPDGGVTVSGILHGLMGERALTAIQAFTTYDGPDDRRTSEQRTADALDNIFEVALRTGTAPTQHGIRPHIRVHVQWADLIAGTGAAELAALGPISINACDRCSPTAA